MATSKDEKIQAQIHSEFKNAPPQAGVPGEGSTCTVYILLFSVFSIILRTASLIEQEQLKKRFH